MKLMIKWMDKPLPAVEETALLCRLEKFSPYVLLIMLSASVEDF